MLSHYLLTLIDLFGNDFSQYTYSVYPDLPHNFHGKQIKIGTTLPLI